MIFEILREDEVVVFQEAENVKELEQGFLFEYRVENFDKEMTIYSLDEDLNRKRWSKKYGKAKNDESVIKRVNEILKNRPKTLDEILFGVIDACDNCDTYDECNLPEKH